MATLQQIGVTGFAGLAPTPVLSHAINTYLVHNKLMNIAEFCNIGMGSNVGNFQASYVYYDAEQSAEFRGLGEEYTSDNAEPKTGTVTLRNLGGSFKVDKAIKRALEGNKTAVSNWTETQIQQKINGIQNGFAKYFITGDNSKNNKAFDGLDVFLKKHPSQVDTVAHVLGEWSEASALATDEHLLTSMNKINGEITCVITTTKGKTKLQTLNRYARRGIEVIEANGQKYDQYLNLPIIDLPDSYFATEDVNGKIPVVFIRFNEVDGVRVAVPMDGTLIDITQPTDGDGTLVKEGAVEFMGAPIFANPYSVSKCFLTETVAQASTVRATI